MSTLAWDRASILTVVYAKDMLPGRLAFSSATPELANFRQSDAGTPLVSDPGCRLVEAAVAQGITVTPIPGASAAMTALSAAGLETDSFHFVGFPAAKPSQRRKQLEEWKTARETVILYEAPHRILATLADIVETLGPDRRVVLGRELTKLHEEFLRGTARDVYANLQARPSIKGEITLLIAPAPELAPEPVEDADLRAEVDALLAAGAPKMDAIKQVAARHGRGKRDVYRVMET